MTVVKRNLIFAKKKEYHAWLIILTETGSVVITDESQFSFLKIINFTFKNSMTNFFANWLPK